MPVATPVDLEDEPCRQGIHDRHAYAVKAAGHLVARSTELAAGVQDCENDFCCGLVRVAGDGLYGNASAVVDHAAAAVGEQGHVDAGAVAGHRLVNGVVDDLPDQMVKASRPCRADEHARP